MQRHFLKKREKLFIIDYNDVIILRNSIYVRVYMKFYWKKGLFLNNIIYNVSLIKN